MRVTFALEKDALAPLLMPEVPLMGRYQCFHTLVTDCGHDVMDRPECRGQRTLARELFVSLVIAH